MKLVLKDPESGGTLLLFKNEENFDRLYYSRDRDTKYFTIAWNAADIEYPAYFSNFFKKHTNATPLEFRNAKVGEA